MAAFQFIGKDTQPYTLMWLASTAPTYLIRALQEKISGDEKVGSIKKFTTEGVTIIRIDTVRQISSTRVEEVMAELLLKLHDFIRSTKYPHPTQLVLSYYDDQNHSTERASSVWVRAT